MPADPPSDQTPSDQTASEEALSGEALPDGAGAGDHGLASAPGRRARRLALPVALLVLLVGAGVLGWQAWLAEQDERGRDRALRAASNALPDILSYDHVNLDEQFAKARRHLTPEFAAEYDELAEKTIRPTAVQYQAAVTAEVVSGGVERADRDDAQALLFVNQTTLTTELPAPRVDQSRVRVRLENTDEGWRIAGIEPL